MSCQNVKGQNKGAKAVGKAKKMCEQAKSPHEKLYRSVKQWLDGHTTYLSFLSGRWEDRSNDKASSAANRADFKEQLFNNVLQF